ncbi:MAG: hypothetical protein D8M58_02055 [Calditrichaeota bacterium]|nr:MAG: hypothetical protein DWQ03_05025 [Calditrichota bacterium]MBL1204151.1 hypothetical protein [Calditrichota bacterium]NOG43982.1 hypothetical protein [Calditrichota bacterium]
MNKSYFFPLALIAVGTILLVNQFDLLNFTLPYLLIVGFAILGVLLIRKAFLTPSRKGLLGGSFFILIASLLLMMDLGIMPIPSQDAMIFPMLLIPLGLSNLIYYAFTRSSFSNVTFGVIFILAALPVLFFYYSSIPFWEVSDIVSTYWPVLLITAGLGFLIDGMLKKAK